MHHRSLSDARLGAIAILGFSFLVTLIAFVSPYWLASDRRLYGAEFDKLGLWETCFRSLRGPNDLEYSKYYSGCRWIFFYEYKNIRGFLLPGSLSLFALHIISKIIRESVYKHEKFHRNLFLVIINNSNLILFLYPFTGTAFFVFTQILFTIGFVLLLLAVIAVLAIQLCFVIEKEIYAMKVLAMDMSAAGEHTKLLPIQIF